MPCRILVADDEELERRALSLILSREGPRGVEIVEASNGAEAVEAVSLGRLDAAFLDIKMPGLDGIEAARLMRGSAPELPIVFLTAHDSFEYARSALRLRVEDFLLKPASAEEVIAALGRALEREDEKKLEEAVSYMADELRSGLAGGRVDEALFARYSGLRGSGEIAAVVAIGPGSFTLRSTMAGIASLAERVFSAEGFTALAGFGDGAALCVVVSPASEAQVPQARLLRPLESLIEGARSELGAAISAGVAIPLPGGCGGLPGGLSGAPLSKAAFGALALAGGTRPLVFLPAARAGAASGVQPVARWGAASRAIELMQARYAEELSLDGVAAELGVSPSHLSRLLARQAGLGFADCLGRLRVENAKAFLVSGGVSVKEAAAMVGFRDPAYFARVFRRFCGMSPAEYRAERRARKGA